jgi:hypothetical protein
VHSACEDKSGDVKDSFYEELGPVFDQSRRYDMKILWGDFNVKVDGRYFQADSQEWESTQN